MLLRSYGNVSCFFIYRDYLPFQSPKAIRVFGKQGYTTQLEEKKFNPAFLGNKNFLKDENGSKPSR